MKFLNREELEKLTTQRLNALCKSIKDRIKYIKNVKLGYSKDLRFLQELKTYRCIIQSVLEKRSLS